jgi:hypothetical protein
MALNFICSDVVGRETEKKVKQHWVRVRLPEKCACNFYCNILHKVRVGQNV